MRLDRGLTYTVHPVTQLGDIKRQKVKLEALKKEAEEEIQRARSAARERVLLDFERGQLGLAAIGPGATTSGTDSKEREWLLFTRNKLWRLTKQIYSPWHKTKV